MNLIDLLFGLFMIYLSIKNNFNFDETIIKARIFNFLFKLNYHLLLIQILLKYINISCKYTN